MMILRRLSNWPMRLDAFIEAHRNVPFAYGSNDCVSFCLGAVEAITGKRLREVDWHDEASAMAAFEAAGGRLAAISGLLGRPQQNWALAQRGDVVMTDQDGVPITMLCIGSHLAGPGPEGLAFKPASEGRMFWKV